MRWTCRLAPTACARCAASAQPPRSSRSSSRTGATPRIATITRSTTTDPTNLLLRSALAREVGRRPLLALGADLAIGDQLADRQSQVLGRRAQLLVDLLDAQARVGLDVRRKLLG